VELAERVRIESAASSFSHYFAQLDELALHLIDVGQELLFEGLCRVEQAVRPVPDQLFVVHARTGLKDSKTFSVRRLRTRVFAGASLSRDSG